MIQILLLLLSVAMLCLVQCLRSPSIVTYGNASCDALERSRLCNSTSVLTCPCKTYFFLADYQLREIPNNYTLGRLCEAKSMKNITVLSKDIAANMTLGQKLTTLGPPNNVDEAMMYELQKIGLFQKPLFKKVISMGHELNPSIFRWNDTVYMARADEHDVLHLFRLNEEYKVVIHLNIQNLSLLPSGEDPRYSFLIYSRFRCTLKT